MRKAHFAFAALVLLALTTIGFAQSGDALRYNSRRKK
jgi:hypothetical protein